MDNTQVNKEKQSVKVDLKRWLREHPNEYGEG